MKLSSYRRERSLPHGASSRSRNCVCTRMISVLEPDQNLLTQIEGRIQNATSKGMKTDCVSWSFCPNLSISEDPVCGSAHCQIADYWAGQLGKQDIVAYQVSRRSGTLYCHLEEEQETVSDSLEVIEVEASSDKPKKGMLRTAIAALKNIGGITEFGKAVIALSEFVNSLIE